VGVARDLEAKYGLVVVARTSQKSRTSSHVAHDAPIPGITIPGARGRDVYLRSSFQRVVERVVHMFLSEVQADRLSTRCGEAGNISKRLSRPSEREHIARTTPREKKPATTKLRK